MTRPASPRVALTVATGILLLAPIEGQAQRSQPAALRYVCHRDVPLIPARPVLAPQESDPWLGADKVRHFGASAAIQIMGFGVLRSASVRQDPALVAAGLTTLAAGVGKELYDRRRGGTPSVRDIVWDLAGIALGSAIAIAADVR